MKSIQKAIIPATLAVGMAFGTVANAQENVQENTLQMTQCTSDVTSDALNTMLDTAIEEMRNGLVMTPAQEQAMQVEMMERLSVGLVQCASDMSGVPVENVPDPETPEFDAFLSERIDMERFELLMQNEMLGIMFEVMPKMMEFEELAQ